MEERLEGREEPTSEAAEAGREMGTDGAEGMTEARKRLCLRLLLSCGSSEGSESMAASCFFSPSSLSDPGAL